MLYSGADFQNAVGTLLGWGLITDAAIPWGTEDPEKVRYADYLQVM